MNPTLIYLLKVNIAIVLFYLFYRLFFANDTFWKTRRIYLLFSIGLSFVYPFFSIESWLQSQPTMQTMVANYALLQEITITPENQSGLISFENILWAVYGLGVAGLFGRLIVQLISIFRIKFQGKRETVQGISIIAIDKKITPFSFFNTVYLNPELHNEHEISQILTHELTHVKQLHSVDVMLSELLCIAFWFNPATWLLKREIRQNLEFLADNKVISSGFDSKSYQYHLLQLSYQSPELKLTNKFNVLPLKKRIKMMNQQKTEKAGILKYLLIVPLSLALVFTSNAESIISAAKSELQSTPTTTAKAANVQKNAKVENQAQSNVQKELVVVGYGATKEKLPAETTASSSSQDGKVIFTVVEKMPQFAGGDQALFKYLGTNIRYPVEAQKAGIQGRVICQYVVDENGAITDVSVVRGVDPSLDQEAVRVIKAMPNWVPGEQRGKKVSVKYTLPINFKLDGSKPKAAEFNAEFKPDFDPSNPPLIVLDGEVLPANFNMSLLKSERIEKIDVLKDASATAIYGDKGKNGVLIITSKK